MGRSIADFEEEVMLAGRGNWERNVNMAVSKVNGGVEERRMGGDGGGGGGSGSSRIGETSKGCRSHRVPHRALCAVKRRGGGGQRAGK
jgi:hypothetical protein